MLHLKASPSQTTPSFVSDTFIRAAQASLSSLVESLEQASREAWMASLQESYCMCHSIFVCVCVFFFLGGGEEEGRFLFANARFFFRFA